MADSTVIALPAVMALLLQSDTFGAVTSIERALIQQVLSESTLTADVTTRLLEAMELSSQRARLWLRNSSLAVNCRLLKSLSSCTTTFPQS